MTKPLILPYRGEYHPNGVSPTISPKAFIAPGAVVIGDVHIGDDTGVWFVLLHACTLEDNCFIGMHATVMDGAVVESGAMLAAGALLTPGKRVPKGQIWAGNPAKYFKDLTEKDLAFFPVSAENYVRHAKEYLALSL